MSIIEQLRELRVIPVASVDSAEEGMGMCRALLEAGLPAVEITFRTAAAEETIRAVSREFPQMVIGAGTILNVADLDRAIRAGARFAVAPGCNRTVLRAALAQDFPFFPGVATPSDIERALEMGIKTLKFFPAESIGGVELLKALVAPYRHTGVGFIPTGGINAENMLPYLAMPEVVAVGGSWMVKNSLLKTGDWQTVYKLTAEAMRAAGVSPLLGTESVVINLASRRHIQAVDDKGGDTVRLFVGLDVTPPVEKAAAEIQSYFRRLDLFSGRFTRPDNLHLTLKFLGEIPAAQVTEIQEALAQVQFAPFTAPLAELGVYDSTSTIRILWVHLGGDDVIELQHNVDEALRPWFAVERSFMSHLTIARIKAVRQREAFLEAVKKCPVPKVKLSVDRFCLKRSTLTPEGPVYANIAEFPARQK